MYGKEIPSIQIVPPKLIWICVRRVYDDRTAIDPEYPSVLPSTGDSPAWAEYVARHAPTEYNEDRNNREDSPLAKDEQYLESDLSLLHAPPG